MRIVSLLPSATEIACALCRVEDLVGRSHECDYPPGIEEVPVLTSARISPTNSSGEIDRAVREALVAALSIYDVDVEGLRGVRPDVIVTQDLCEVCAVSVDDVKSAVARLARHDVAIVSLRPTRLGDIWDDIRRVAEATGRPERGEGVVAGLTERVRKISERSRAQGSRPGVLTIEWIDPVMIGGMWMPELVDLAGGEPLVTKPGDYAPTLGVGELEALDPDVVLVKPCGFDLARTQMELPLLASTLPRSWRAVTQGRVYITDGNAFFNRPGPRIVESLEILAACTHPDAFGDFAEKHRESVFRFDGV